MSFAKDHYLSISDGRSITLKDFNEFAILVFI